MGYYRTQALQWTDEITLHTPNSLPIPWLLGDWVEAIALTSGPTQLVQIAIRGGAHTLKLDGQINFATGTAGNEINLGHKRLRYGQDAGDSINSYPFRVPLLINAGERVSCALECSIDEDLPLSISLGYTVSDPSDQSTALRYAAIPDTQTSPTFAPAAGAWTYSDWYLMSSGLGTGAYLDALIVIPPNALSTTYQAQVGIGDTPAVISTFKGYASNNGGVGQQQSMHQGHSFPRPYFVDANTSIWVRYARAGVNASAWGFAFEYLEPSLPAGGSITVNKVLIPNTDPTVFTINAGGGLSPTSILLGTSGSYVFSGVAVGSGYSIDEESGSWLVSYDVSNGSSHGDISVAADEAVIVTITNQLSELPIITDVSEMDCVRPNPERVTVTGTGFVDGASVVVTDPDGNVIVGSTTTFVDDTTLTVEFVAPIFGRYCFQVTNPPDRSSGTPFCIVTPCVETVPIRRLRRTTVLSDENKWIFHKNLTVDYEAGVGLTSGQGSDPKLLLRWSDDGGHQWSDFHAINIGKIGSYRHRALWRRLGRSRKRIYELVISDPIKAVLIDGYVDVEEGTS